jgi:hypothetical protein
MLASLDLQDILAPEMAALDTFFRNRFPQRLSDEGLKRYAREHIRRLDGAGPEFRKAGAETRVLYDAYYGMTLQGRCCPP